MPEYNYLTIIDLKKILNKFHIDHIYLFNDKKIYFIKSYFKFENKK